MGFNNLLTRAFGRTEIGFAVCGTWLLTALVVTKMETLAMIQKQDLSKSFSPCT